MMPMIVLLRLAMPSPWDEEEAERTITYYMRRTMLGYVPMTLWDILMIPFVSQSSGEAAWKKVPLFLPPGIQTPTKYLLKEIAKEDEE